MLKRRLPPAVGTAAAGKTARAEAAEPPPLPCGARETNRRRRRRSGNAASAWRTSFLCATLERGPNGPVTTP